MENNQWYYVAFDTQGSGFAAFNNPSNYFAYGMKELKQLIIQIKKNIDIDDESIVVFELSNIKVSTDIQYFLETAILVNVEEIK